MDRDGIVLDECRGKWAAIYLPMLNNGQMDPSRHNFESKQKAEEYMFSCMCRECQAERQRAIDGAQDPDGDHEDSAWPACTCEWLVLPTEEYMQCENMLDIFEAVGWEAI